MTTMSKTLLPSLFDMTMSKSYTLVVYALLVLKQNTEFRRQVISKSSLDIFDQDDSHVLRNDNSVAFLHKKKDLVLVLKDSPCSNKMERSDRIETVIINWILAFGWLLTAIISNRLQELYDETLYEKELVLLLKNLREEVLESMRRTPLSSLFFQFIRNMATYEKVVKDIKSTEKPSISDVILLQESPKSNSYLKYLANFPKYSEDLTRILSLHSSNLRIQHGSEISAKNLKNLPMLLGKKMISDSFRLKMPPKSKSFSRYSEDFRQSSKTLMPILSLNPFFPRMQPETKTFAKSSDVFSPSPEMQTIANHFFPRNQLETKVFTSVLEDFCKYPEAQTNTFPFGPFSRPQLLETKEYTKDRENFYKSSKQKRISNDFSRMVPQKFGDLLSNESEWWSFASEVRTSNDCISYNPKVSEVLNVKKSTITPIQLQKNGFAKDYGYFNKAPRKPSSLDDFFPKPITGMVRCTLDCKDCNKTPWKLPSLDKFYNSPPPGTRRFALDCKDFNMAPKQQKISNEGFQKNTKKVSEVFDKSVKKSTITLIQLEKNCFEKDYGYFNKAPEKPKISINFFLKVQPELKGLTEECEDFCKSLEKSVSTTSVDSTESQSLKSHQPDSWMKNVKICDLCQESISEKKFFDERRFGILSNCDCKFCYGCIRKIASTSDKVIKGPVKCTLCFKESDIVALSVCWVEGEEKVKFFKTYCKNMAELINVRVKSGWTGFFGERNNCIKG